MQGFDRTKTAYYSTLQPYLSIWGVTWCTIFILINGYDVFFAFKASDFLVAYINIPIFIGLYVGYKLWKRTKAWSADEMDFVRGIPTIEETEAPYVPPRTLGEKIFDILF